MLNKDIIVVFDTEYTSWEGSWQHGWNRPGELMELVQIGALKLDVNSGMQELDAFEVLVRPAKNPQLSGYFTDLTGITQDMVDDDGMSFPDALTAFSTFMGPDTGKALMFGIDDEVIELNCRLNNMAFPFDAEFFQDVEPFIREALGKERRSFCSSDLPKLLGFLGPQLAHQAIDDARCLAEALRILRFKI